jgi:DNA-binding transcriptional LysR family regulator
MDLRHLRYAVAIAEELHFTRAAERLGIGQPPLSQQIKLLEQELGVLLFHRLTRGVELTEAGRAFLPFARQALAAAEQAAAAAKQAARGEVGALSLGFTSSASFSPLVMGLISRFRTAYPHVELSLNEQTTSRLLEALRSGALDLAFLRPGLNETEGLNLRRMPDEEFWAALPAGHRLSGESRIDLVELAGDPFILYPRANGQLLYDSIIAACRNAGFSPRLAQEAPQMASSVSLVAAGVGVALVPESMRQLQAPGVTFARLQGDAPKAQLFLAHRKDGLVKASIRNFIALTPATKL